ncbi:hypothetical protein MCUN1_002265 [Malassezia cuniculi]|uniref:triacylglycerol lipase n=1 Tax=Malassezia cuniculi TaxID=948313 RepID=A0AAF0EW37_9BASI|nr:hypothetical protein MCUN1_002265 [Malassezia cuniculi]
MWRSLSPEERRLWDIAAEEERERHRKLHPDYKYRPSTRRVNVHRRNIRRSSGTERQCESIADAILKACGREGVKKNHDDEVARPSCLRSHTMTLEESHAIVEEKPETEHTPQLYRFLPRRSSSAPPITANLLELVRPETSASVDSLLAPPLSPCTKPETDTESALTQFTNESREQVFGQLTLSPEQLFSGSDAPAPPRVFEIEQSMENFSLGPSFLGEVPKPTETEVPLSLSPSKSTEPQTTNPSPVEDDVADLWANLLSSIAERPITFAGSLSSLPDTMRLLFLLLALVYPLLVLANGRQPYPDDDPFYTPPHGWEDSQPGDILRSRKIEPGAYGAVRLNVDAWQILYRTERTNSTPLATVTTILVPSNADTSKLVSMASPENACTTKCAPSWLFHYTGHIDLSNLEPRWEQLVYLSFLQRGWIVVSPDHEGPNSAFSAGIQQGKATLDSMRAVLNFQEINWADKVEIIGHGYSGGAIANGWAAALQHIYAPELNVIGWSLGGTPSDPAMTLNFLDGSLSAGIVVNGAVGLAQGYPEIEAIMNKKWTEDGWKAVADARNNCIYEMVFLYANQTFQSNKFIKGESQIAEIPTVRKVLDSLVLGNNRTLTPKAPVFMFHAAYDEEIVWYQANNTAVNWCENGANIRFLTESSFDLNHVSTYLLNVPYIIQFMQDRFDGKDYYGGGCQFDNMVENPAWDPTVLGEGTEELLVSVLALLGQEIGSKDSLLQFSVSENQIPGTRTKLPILDNQAANGTSTNKAIKSNSGTSGNYKNNSNSTSAASSGNNNGGARIAAIHGEDGPNTSASAANSNRGGASTNGGVQSSVTDTMASIPTGSSRSSRSSGSSRATNASSGSQSGSRSGSSSSSASQSSSSELPPRLGGPMSAYSSGASGNQSYHVSRTSGPSDSSSSSSSTSASKTSN